MIEFETSRLKSVESSDGTQPPLFLSRVEYDLDTQSKLFDDIMNQTIPTICRDRAARKMTGVMDIPNAESILFWPIVTFYAGVFKGCSWEHEQEWRLICAYFTSKKRDDDLLGWRVKQRRRVPYYKFRPTKSNGLLPIKSITVGPQSRPDWAKDKVERLLSQNKYHDVPVYVSKLQSPSDCGLRRR